MPYNLCMANQTIAKPFGFIKDLKIFIHGIPYTITFTIINSNVLDFSYSMLLRRHGWEMLKYPMIGQLILLPYMEHVQYKNHTCYQETWCSDQKTWNPSMLWFPFWNIRWKGGYDVCHKVKFIFNKNHNNTYSY